MFNEKQVGALLRRAAELQAGTPSDEAGLTLDEVQTAAAEAGIDPRFVAQAAAELRVRPVTTPQEGFAFWGAPVHLSEERVLAHPLDEDEWGAVVREAQRIYGQVGELRSVGTTRTWSYGNKSTTVMGLSVTTRRGQTIVSAHRNLTQEIAGTFAGGGPTPIVFSMLLAFEGLAFLPVGLRVAVAMTLVLAIYLALRGIVYTVGRVQRRKMAGLLDAVEQVAGETEALSEAHAEAASRPALDLGPLGDEPREHAPVATRHRTR